MEVLAGAARHKLPLLLMMPLMMMIKMILQLNHNNNSDCPIATCNSTSLQTAKVETARVGRGTRARSDQESQI